MSIKGIKIFAILFFTLALGCTAFAAIGIGSDAAYPFIAKYLESIPFERGKLYKCTLSNLRDVMNLAADIQINVFEVIDCFYRWCAPRGIRIAIYGKDLRQIEREFNLGGQRILAILALENLERLEIGAILNREQCALDMHLSAPYEKYIEIGTAIYERRAGFRKVSPKLFDEAYGISVKRFFIKTELTRLELFEPGRGAIYVEAISRPKRWNLDLVKRN